MFDTWALSAGSLKNSLWNLTAVFLFQKVFHIEPFKEEENP